MTPDYQTLFNIAMATAAFFGGWLIKTVSTSVRDLQKSDTELASKVSDIAIQVVGGYVTRAEFQRGVEDMKATLRRIEDKLDHKQDKR